MNDSKTLANWSRELQELHQTLEEVSKQRAVLFHQMRALEMQTAVLRTREQEITREIERMKWGTISHRVDQNRA
jgi:hypothetical protein